MALPAQTPERGGAHDAQGLYSEELVRIVVAMNTKEMDAPTAMFEASRRKEYLSKTACRIPNILPTRV